MSEVAIVLLMWGVLRLVSIPLIKYLTLKIKPTHQFNYPMNVFWALGLIEAGIFIAVYEWFL